MVKVKEKVTSVFTQLGRCCTQGLHTHPRPKPQAHAHTHTHTHTHTHKSAQTEFSSCIKSAINGNLYYMLWFIHKQTVINLRMSCSCYAVNQQVQTFRQNYSGILIRQLRHVPASPAHHEVLHSCIKQHLTFMSYPVCSIAVASQCVLDIGWIREIKIIQC